MMKEKAIHVRVAPTLKDELDKMCDEVGIEPPAILRSCIKSLLEFYQQNGYLYLPVTIVPTRTKARKSKAAA